MQEDEQKITTTNKRQDKVELF